MRILFLSNIAKLILDIVAWVIFHLSIGVWCSRIPTERFKPEKWVYQTKPWEKGGEIYEKIFHVKSWKGLIPSGAALYRNAYEVKHLTNLTIENARLWIKESCRSEFCHFAMIFPGFFFFLWNSVEGGWWMIAYAILNNLVPIVMQRYNRPRVYKVLAQLERKLKQKSEIVFSYEPQTALSNSYE
ncbi:MAG: glycosyl-4,4'-diaponeurosporenoate acyltransferase CrtO family protein [Anaerolineaceae bacterium]